MATKIKNIGNEAYQQGEKVNYALADEKGVATVICDFYEQLKCIVLDLGDQSKQGVPFELFNRGYHSAITDYCQKYGIDKGKRKFACISLSRVKHLYSENSYSVLGSLATETLVEMNDGTNGCPYQHLREELKALIANLPNKENRRYGVVNTSELEKLPTVVPSPASYSRVSFQTSDGNQSGRIVAKTSHGLVALVADDQENETAYEATAFDFEMQAQIATYLNTYPDQKGKRCFRWLGVSSVKPLTYKVGDIVEYSLTGFNNPHLCKVIKEADENGCLTIAYIGVDQPPIGFDKDTKTTPINADWLRPRKKTSMNEPTKPVATTKPASPLLAERTRISYHHPGESDHGQQGYVVLDDPTISTTSVAIEWDNPTVFGAHKPSDWGSGSLLAKTMSQYLDKYPRKDKQTAVFRFEDRSRLTVIPVVKEKTMSNEKPSVWEMVKDNSKEAGYRIAATQVVNVVRTGICAAMQKQGAPDGHIQAVAEFLKTELGFAVISAVLGMAIPQLPGKVSNDPRVAKLCEELRINGMATAGNAAMGAAMEYLLPALQEALKNLPELPAEETKADTKARVSVEHKKEEAEEQEEQQVQGKAASA